MSKKKSRFSQKGGGTYSWKSIELFSSRTKPRKLSQKAWKRRLHAQNVLHWQDRQRQKHEQGIMNWPLVRVILDDNPQMTLEAAKQIAGSIQL